MKGYIIATNQNKSLDNRIQYKVGKTLDFDEEKYTGIGFYFGFSIVEALNNASCYNYNPTKHNVLEITALGNVVGMLGKYYIANKIKVERLLSQEEVEELCTGKFIMHDKIIHYDDGKINNYDGAAITYFKHSVRKFYKNGKITTATISPGMCIEDVAELYKTGNIPKEIVIIAPDIYNRVLEEWYQNGKQNHGDNNPSVLYENGDKEYHQNGKLVKYEYFHNNKLVKTDYYRTTTEAK